MTPATFELEQSVLYGGVDRVGTLRTLSATALTGGRYLVMFNSFGFRFQEYDYIEVGIAEAKGVQPMEQMNHMRVRIGVVGLQFGREIVNRLRAEGSQWFEAAAICGNTPAKVERVITKGRESGFMVISPS